MNIFGKLLKINKRNDMLKLFEKFGIRQDLLVEKSYENNVEAYSVVRKIMDVFSGCDWMVEEKIDGDWVKVEDTSIHDLLENPNRNKNYTFKDIDEQMIIYLLCSGNSYLYGEKLNGKIQELDVFPSNHIDIEASQNFFLPNLKYRFELGNINNVYTQDDLEHIKLFNPNYQSVEDSYRGLSVFDVAKQVVQVGNDRWDASAHLFQNRGMAGLVTDQSDRPMTEPEARAVQNSFKKGVSGTDKFGGVRVTNKDLKYISMAMSSTDLQLIEQGVITLRAICNVLGLDSSLFNDPSNKTFNNRLEAEKAMYSNVIVPLSEKIAAKHTNFIAKNHYPEGNYRIRKDFSYVEALQKDKKFEAQKDKIVMDGISTVMKMDISMESKVALLEDKYDLSDEFINALKKQKDEPISD